MHHMGSRIFLYGLVMAVTLGWVSCVDNNDTPPPEVAFIPGQVVTVDQVKSLYAEQMAKSWQQRMPVHIDQDWAIRGIITASDKKDGNLYKEAFIQDNTTGLRMLFDATSGLYIGDSVIVNVQGLYLGDYGDFIQLGSEPYLDDSGNRRVSGFNMDKQIRKISIGNGTVPVTATIPQVKSSAWLGKLVKIENVQFDDSETGLTWADAMADPPVAANRDLSDCSGNTIIVRTSGYASFANETLPAGKGSLTGIITVFSGDYQLLVRDYREVQLEGDRCGFVPQPPGTPVETLSQNFEGFKKDNETVYLAGWQNLATAGGRLWLAKVFSGNTYVQATAYNSGLSSMVAWLITNPVNVSSQKILTFQTAKAYWTHTGTGFPLELLFSTDYNGKTPATATWIPLSATLAGKNDPDHTFMNSGNVNLPVVAGKAGFIAFRYTGSSSQNTSYRIDNIVVKAAN